MKAAIAALTLLFLSAGAQAQVHAQPIDLNARPGLSFELLRLDALPHPRTDLAATRPLRIQRNLAAVSSTSGLFVATSSTVSDDIFGPARWLGKRMTIVGLASGIAYSFGGLIIDARTTGLNRGTALAFGALVGMPVIFGAAGFAAGALGGAAVVGFRKVF